MLTTELRNVKRDRIPKKKIYFWENQHHFWCEGKKFLMLIKEAYFHWRVEKLI